MWRLRCREPLCGTLPGFGGLDLAILRWSRRDEILEQVLGDVSDLVHGTLEGIGIGLRGFRGAADLTHVLQGGGVDFLPVRSGLEVMENVDVSAHPPTVAPHVFGHLLPQRPFYPHLGNNGDMAVFRNDARLKADRIAALVAGIAFLAGIGLMALGNAPSTAPAPTAVSTTVVSSPIPGPDVTETELHTAPPLRATLPPVVTQEVTTTSGGATGTVVVTTAPATAAEPFLGSRVASIVFQLLLVTLTSLFLAFAVHRILLGEYGGGRARVAAASVGSVPAVDVDEAAAVKSDVVAASETADLSRPLYEKGGITDARLRLLQSRIALELEVRKLAQNHDLPSGLTIPYVIAGLVEKKAMTERLATGITALSSIGDRLGLGAELSPDTTTLLTESYAQALAKVGGKIKK